MAAVEEPLTQKAIDWLRNFLQKEHGIWFVRCEKRGDFWFCYDQQGAMVIKLDDAIVDRIFLAQERLEWEWVEAANQAVNPDGPMQNDVDGFTGLDDFWDHEEDGA